MSNEIINPYQTFYDDSGVPLANGTISFFVNTTAVLGTIFSDESLLVAQANPYTLDAFGRIVGDVKYTGLRTLLIKTDLGATVRTIDNMASSNNQIDVEFNVLADAKSSDLVVGNVVSTNGYNTVDDGGHSIYEVMTLIAFGGTPDESVDHTADNGTVLSLILRDGVTIFAKQAGVIESITTTVPAQAWLDYANTNSLRANYGGGTFTHDTITIGVNTVALEGEGITKTFLISSDGKDLHVLGHAETFTFQDDFEYGNFKITMTKTTDTADTTYRDRCGPGGENIANCALSYDWARMQQSLHLHTKFLPIRCEANGDGQVGNACFTNFLPFASEWNGFRAHNMPYSVITGIPSPRRITSTTGANIVVENLTTIKKMESGVESANPPAVGDEVTVIFDTDEQTTETVLPRITYKIKSIVSNTVQLEDAVTAATITFATNIGGHASGAWFCMTEENNVEVSQDNAKMIAPQFTAVGKLAFSILNGTNITMLAPSVFFNFRAFRIFSGGFGGPIAGFREAIGMQLISNYMEGPFNNTTPSGKELVHIEGKDIDIFSLSVANSSLAVTPRVTIIGDNIKTHSGTLAFLLFLTGSDNIIVGTQAQAGFSISKNTGNRNKIIATFQGNPGGGSLKNRRDLLSTESVNHKFGAVHTAATANYDTAIESGLFQTARQIQLDTGHNLIEETTSHFGEIHSMSAVRATECFLVPNINFNKTWQRQENIPNGLVFCQARVRNQVTVTNAMQMLWSAGAGGTIGTPFVNVSGTDWVIIQGIVDLRRVSGDELSLFFISDDQATALMDIDWLSITPLGRAVVSEYVCSENIIMVGTDNLYYKLVQPTGAVAAAWVAITI